MLFGQSKDIEQARAEVMLISEEIKCCRQTSRYAGVLCTRCSGKSRCKMQVNLKEADNSQTSQAWIGESFSPDHSSWAGICVENRLNLSTPYKAFVVELIALPLALTTRGVHVTCRLMCTVMYPREVCRPRIRSYSTNECI